jgi:hypothetical protein
MQTEIEAFIAALARAKPRARPPKDGRVVVATFRLQRDDRRRKASFIKSVPYMSGGGGGLGGCAVELEVDDGSGYVTSHSADGPEQAIDSAAAASGGWTLEAGSIDLPVALGFSQADKRALVAALATVLTGRFR